MRGRQRNNKVLATGLLYSVSMLAVVAMSAACSQKQAEWNHPAPNSQSQAGYIVDFSTSRLDQSNINQEMKMIEQEYFASKLYFCFPDSLD